MRSPPGKPDWLAVEERVALLGTLRLFRELPPELLRQVAAHLRVKRVARGDFVFLEGIERTA